MFFIDQPLRATGFHFHRLRVSDSLKMCYDQ